MSINWQDLRPWDASQRLAFELLCCQLAEYEPVPPGSCFVRKGSPDAGVECFWRLPNGDECGWQAKFFRSPLGPSQWSQLDGSVKRAIEKHPQLTVLTVCLPIDRPERDAGEHGWSLHRWHEQVSKWKGWAEEKNMAVEFHYWGEHEIWERLTREEHAGRHLFWFNKDLFSQRWFEDRLGEAIENVGRRYMPAVHVDLPVARLFEGLGRTPDFFAVAKSLYAEVYKTCAKACSPRAQEVANDTFSSLRDHTDTLGWLAHSGEGEEVAPIDWCSAAELARKSTKAALECLERLQAAQKAESESSPNEGSKPSSRLERFASERYYLGELIRRLEELRGLARSSEARLSNVPAMLLVGSAGSGKTHLFCDVAANRVRDGLPTILLLGEHFDDSEPWSQIVRLMGLSCTKDELLGALEAAAQARGVRAVILIDALNEGDGRWLWSKHLAGMLAALGRYPWLGIALSVRSSYEEALIPDHLVPVRLVREEHRGFAGHEYQATRKFFDHFGIQSPTVPLLVPEFQNPLFLMLFCRGLQNRGLTKPPSGLDGITAIFEFFLESIQLKLSGTEYLDFDPKSQPVKNAVQSLAQAMADRGSHWIARDEAQTGVNSLLPREGYEHSLFRHMISEGLISEDIHRTGDDEWCETVRFTYERFADHLIVNCLLDRYLDIDGPCAAFSPDQPLGSLVKDPGTCWANRGLIEALCVQVPERIEMELADVAPSCADFQAVREAFVASLIWRDPGAVGATTLDYINDHVVQYDDTRDQFLDALLTLASNPRHPYNARFLHNHLIALELAERDAWWSVFLHHQYGSHGAVDRLVDWAWSAEDKSHIDDDSVMLCGLALAWFLTASNRFLRDRATKALVCLMTDRLHVLRRVLNELVGVNDPYVLERLLAVAYGCAMRSDDGEAIASLASDVYECIFETGAPPPDILLRDYARGVIEVALHRTVDLDIDYAKVTPPYGSQWPSQIPTKEELDRYGEWQDGMADEEWARVHLHHSVMGDLDDFARYVIGAHGADFEWSSRGISDRRPPTAKEAYEAFVESLTPRQKTRWERYYAVRTNAKHLRLLDEATRAAAVGFDFTDEQLEAVVADSEQSLRKTLGKKKLEILDRHVLPYLDDPDAHRDEHVFDLSLAQRWILQKVLDLGWTVERFARFDRYLMLYCDPMQTAHKAERIGKKYQWIAYHEVLARIADNFEFIGDAWAEQPGDYDGTWQISSLRDIDPSCLLRRTEREEWDSHSTTWWFTPVYDSWHAKPDDVAWLEASEDLPSVEPLVEVTNPEDGSRWLVLEGYYRWEQPTPPGQDPFENARRRIWYLLGSYIVRKADADELFEWAAEQNWSGRWMPESRELYDVFLGEFFWAPAFQHHDVPYYSRDGWTRGWRDCIPKQVLVSTDRYAQEYGDYDCSLDGPIHIYLPSKWLVDNIGLRCNGVEGRYFDGSGNLMAFDPSVTTRGPGTLLMNRSALLEALGSSEHEVLWTILGEKGIIGGGVSPPKWHGRLELSGAYRIREGTLEGVINAKFVS